MKKDKDEQKIKVIFLDVDGTLTDGKVYYDSCGNEMKAFNIKDGLIISAMVKIGYLFIVLTGRKSVIVNQRMEELGIKEVYQEISLKEQFIKEYLERNNLQHIAYAYIGDDINDISAMKRASFKGCPADACEMVIELSDCVSNKKGGAGAVRDVLEELIKKNNDWEEYIRLFERDYCCKIRDGA